MSPPASQASTKNTGATNNEMAVHRTSMAAERSIMAADRSLMAWIRTGLSMFGFGFTIYKFLNGMQANVGVVAQHSPRDVGLFLVALGTLGVVAGTVEYWFHRRDLLRYSQIAIWRPSFVMAIVMSSSGVVLLISIAMKLL